MRSILLTAALGLALVTPVMADPARDDTERHARIDSEMSQVERSWASTVGVDAVEVHASAASASWARGNRGLDGRGTVKATADR